MARSTHRRPTQLTFPRLEAYKGSSCAVYARVRFPWCSAETVPVQMAASHPATSLVFALRSVGLTNRRQEWAVVIPSVIWRLVWQWRGESGIACRHFVARVATSRKARPTLW